MDMSIVVAFVITLLAGGAVGALFLKFKAPGGMLVGSLLGALVLNMTWGAAYVPVHGRILAQLTAGAFIGSSMSRSDIHRLKKIWKPALIVIGMHLLFTLFLGGVIYIVSPLDAATAYFSAVPGGMTEIPLISADMGANAAKVVVMQFTRMLVALGVFPIIIAWLSKKHDSKSPPTAGEPSEELAEEAPPPPGEKPGSNGTNALLTFALALAAGLAGAAAGIPAGTLGFSIVAIVAFNLICGRAYLPKWLRRLAQLLAGTFVGSSVSQSDLLEMRFLIVPAIILIAAYSLSLFSIGWLLRKACPEMSMKESMLTALPAGASDMALISMDMGVNSTNLVVLQIARLVAVSVVFPQIISLVLWILS